MDDSEQMEALRREIDALFRAARRRGAAHAAAIARELGLDALAEAFLAEAREADEAEHDQD